MLESTGYTTADRLTSARSGTNPVAWFLILVGYVYVVADLFCGVTNPIQKLNYNFDLGDVLTSICH